MLQPIYFLGSEIFPSTAEAATVAGEAKYTNPSGLPILPLKLRLVVLIAVSPGAITPIFVPAQGPQQEGQTIAPAYIKV
jgi:hypothetical protein